MRHPRGAYLAMGSILLGLFVLVLVAVMASGRHGVAVAYGDGEYTVGTGADMMPPGRYKVDHVARSQSCKYGAYSSRDQFNSNGSGALRTPGKNGTATMTLRAGSFFSSSGCGTWHRLGRLPA